jgi:beta-galactosidase
MKLHRLLLSLLSLASCALATPPTSPSATQAFSIGETEFLLNGKPHVIRCGEIHFPRVPREYWRHRLQMCRAMGLNTVCVYLFWNYHEWEEGRYEWSGQADVAEFCRLAQAEGLWVILRPGPYSCAEWEMGGLPWWLLKNEGLTLRTTDPRFLQPATRYLREVGRVLAPLQITRGGPLLMVQVENEYGSYGRDTEYMGALRQALLDGGFDVPLFACNPVNDLTKGYRRDLFQVVNFGAGAAKRAFEALRQVQPTGPLMNGEYYPAWFDTWGRKHRTGAIGPIAADLDYMLSNRHSFSIYMAHGGTSFGFWSGADRPFSPDTSSYDYDAPISEAGWRTPKFDAFLEVFKKHLQPGEEIPAAPPANPVIAIPAFTLAESAPVLQDLPAPVASEAPLPMELRNQSRGLSLYRTTLPAGEAATLTADAVHDFAWVLVDGVQAGIMDRRSKRLSVRLPARTRPARLDILVEAMGRVNFGREVFDRKGLQGRVLLASGKAAPAELRGWQTFALPLDAAQLAGIKYSTTRASGAAFWRGSFELARAGDSFLDLRTWGKGVVWVNGHCLGRFWNIGPTQTMYLPGPWLREGRNDVVVLDLLGPDEPRLAGLTTPILGELHPEKDFAKRSRATGGFSRANSTQVAAGVLSSDTQWQPIPLAKGTRGRYLCFEAQSSLDGENFVAIAELDAVDASGQSLSKEKWKVLWVDSEDALGSGTDAENLLDGQSSSHWGTQRGEGAPGFPHRIVIDLGESIPLNALRYLPRAGGPKTPGRVKDYCILVSDSPFSLEPAKE